MAASGPASKAPVVSLQDYRSSAVTVGGWEDAPDESLAVAITEGSHDAFAELYRRYARELYDFAARIMHDRAAAADVVQAVFASAWERASRGEQLRSPRAWLYRAARNASIDELRRRRRTATADERSFDFAAVEEAPSHEPGSALIEREVAELVWSTAATLAPDEYALLDLYVRRELTPDELAGELGITAGAVHTRLSRLRRSFEEALTVKLLTRRGGRDCEELDRLVSMLGDGAERGPGQRLLRDHIRDCSACQESRRRHVSATEVLASLAPVPLLPATRDAIWASLSSLLGSGGGGATGGGGAVATPSGRASVVVRARGRPRASGALVLSILAVLGLGTWAGSRALFPGRSPAAASDPTRFWSPSHETGKRSSANRITIAWQRQPAAVSYSVGWGHAPREEPDTVPDLPGRATRTTSPALAPGRWYFHLRTEGRGGGWTGTVHVGPFLIAAPPASSPRPEPVGPDAVGVAAGAEPTGGGRAPSQEVVTGPASPPAGGQETTTGVTARADSTANGDSTPPTGQRVELRGSGYYRTLAVPLMLGPGADTGSGVDHASGLVERQTGVLAAGACTGWSRWQAAAIRGSADTNVADGRCYRYRYRISDRAGNRSPFSPPSGAAAVDTTPPEPPTLSLIANDADSFAVATTLLYRPAGDGGAFVVAATASDAASGLAAITFPALANGMAPTTATRRTAWPYATAYTWRSGALESGAKTVIASDRAGNISRARFTLAADAVAPAGVSVSLVGGPWFVVPVVPLLVGSGSDAGSGVDAGSLVVERDAAVLAGGACGAFAEGWTAVSLQDGADRSVESGGCYRYRVRVSDKVGNLAVSAVSGEARVDTSPPSPPSLSLYGASGAVGVSGTTVFYAAAAGSFSVAAAVEDRESGVAAVVFPAVAGASGGGVDASAPYESGYNWSDPLAVAGAQTVTASNGAGLTADSTFTLAADLEPPTGCAIILLAGPTYPGGAVPFRIVEGSDSGSGVLPGSALVERDSALLGGDGVCGPYSGAWAALSSPGTADTTVESGHCYRYRVTVSDNAGNRSISDSTGDAIVP